MKCVYIYTLEHPITGDIRYVGKTVNPNKRKNDHNSISYNRKNNTRLSAWIISLCNQGLKPKMLIIDQITDLNWEWLEQYWISQFKAWNFNLVNHSIGGGGHNGIKMSEEFCEKQSKLKRGRKVPQNVIEDFKIRITGNTFTRGEKNHKAKLTEIEVIQICKLINEGKRAVDIAKIIPNSNPNIIGLIKMGKTWQHISKIHLL